MNLSEEFLAKGIVKIPVENLSALEVIKHFIYSDNAKPETLNEFRLGRIEMLKELPNLKELYYSLARNALDIIVGNELAIQRHINLSIQLPGDASSLLPIHCDTWSGDSPYEVVLWVPLVDCYGTKSMFYTHPDNQPALAGKTTEQLFQESNAYFVDCKYGECLIFSQNYMHGNRVNETQETRWSLNCRFKGLLSPYADKKLGEFFEPITIRPATILGMKYEHPKI